MTRVRESRLLFTRGAESVRLVREEHSTRCRLSVCGPGIEIETSEFDSLAECMRRQREIEQGLLAAGYHIALFPADRRSDHGTWRGVDQRRAAG
jgi:hypothetical protein